MTERKLARIAQITATKPIPGADRIECAIVDNGWEVVIRKGEYAPGDVAVYCEIDAWVPHELAPFLTPKDREPKEYNGVKGERLRTIRLKGQVSQGLLLPIETTFFRDLGTDVTGALGIQKWEAPIPACLSGEIKGAFPSFIPKTDQERCQNLHDEIFGEHYDEVYEVTVKLDGTSCTIFHNDGNVGVCGRNWELRETEGNTLWRCARSQGLIDGLQALGYNMALQGEVIGEGIQGNQEKLKGQHFYLYDIYDIDARRYLTGYERTEIVKELQSALPTIRLNHVPIVGTYRVLSEEVIESIDELLKFAEGPSLNEKVQREGLVFKSCDTAFTFKAISNRWLLKNQ
jgi:RNA ligase (TIGR02306 family)